VFDGPLVEDALRLPSRRRLLGVGMGATALLVVSQVIWWAEPVALFRVLEWAAPRIVWRVPTNQPLVALSFDDGPNPKHTPEVLALLAQHGAHATFFLIGSRAAAHPELVAAIGAGGHEVGNHYLHRGTTLGDGREAFAANLTRAEQIIGLSTSPKLFRPPGGVAWPSQLRQACELGYTSVLGSAYPHDPAHPPVGYIEWLVKKNMVPGAIVILHDGISDPARSLQALPEILAEGKRRGIRFVSVGELLQGRGGRRTTGCS
jgi:peptidoglycan/xylan/chitin deacetylase (PgdA/CDA1 family)